MTFTELVNDVAERLNYTSAEAITRLGRNLNTRYKRLTTSLGLVTARRTEVQATATLGVRLLTFDAIEKIITVSDRSSGTDNFLEEVSPEALDGALNNTSSIGAGQPTRYAIYRMNKGSVQIKMDTVPQTEFTLYAAGHATAATLSGSQEPAFSESYHDILIFGMLADEYKKLEKVQYAKDAEADYESRLSDLKFWNMKSTMSTTFQGKASAEPFGGVSSSGSGGGGSSVNGALSYTQTGLITFDRDPSAPFAVTSGSAKVTNLDADLVDGINGIDLSGYFNVLTYGAIGDGVVNDTVAIQAAITAADAAGGGVVFFPPNRTYKCTGQLTINDCYRVVLKGYAILTYSGTSSPFIAMNSSLWCGIEDLLVQYTNAGFSGKLVKTGHSAAVSDSGYLTFDRVMFLGSGVSGAAALLEFDKAIICRAVNCLFQGAVVGVLGGSGGYANSIELRQNTYVSITTPISVPCINGCEAWSIANNTFEPNASNQAAGISVGGGGQFGYGIHVENNWFGDVASNGGGPWITFNGVLGGSILSNRCSSPGAGGGDFSLSLTGVQGIAIHGNRFEGGKGITFGAACSGVTIAGNDFQNTTPLTNETNVTNLSILSNVGLHNEVKVTTIVSTSVGTQNNWAPGADGVHGHTFIEWNGASAATITGIDSGKSGQLVTIKNITAAQIATFSHASGSSDADNRFTNRVTSAGTPIAPKGSLTYQHDGAGWQLVAHEQGAWITPTFAAGDYTASAGNWVLDAGDVATLSYKLDGAGLTVQYDLRLSDVSATPTSLQRAIPGGFVSTKASSGTGMATDNGATRELGVWATTASGSLILFQLGDLSAWATTAADNTGAFGVAQFEVT